MSGEVVAAWWSGAACNGGVQEYERVVEQDGGEEWVEVGLMVVKCGWRRWGGLFPLSCHALPAPLMTIPG